ncbi:MAG: diacylglycerol kinase [Pseudomonadota bacterium]
MKNQSLSARSRNALAGIAQAIRYERSFRLHLVAACVVAVALCILKPEAIWIAVTLIAAAAVLAAELVNTALETLADHLHPEQHASIRIAKDCAAGAVLVTALAAAGVGLCLAIHLVGR